jgi:S-adenosyl-L-methionine hydrolase (adenosine-forming)
LAQRIVTLTTDFGLTEHYVGAMKGVILSVHPEAKIVDICNSVQSYDVLDGAITIANAYRHYPSDTIHVVVVDPGVGTVRRPIVATTERHIFLAPDNGVLSLVYEREERLSVRHITSEHFFQNPVSNTFHGRDVFASVAGWMSKGVEAVKLGDEITDFVRFAAPKPKPLSPTSVKALVLRVDKFGNIVTNLRPEDVPSIFGEPAGAFTLTVGKAQVTKVHTNYSQASPGELFAIVGSMGYVEISANRQPAAALAGINKGAEGNVTFAAAAAAAPQAAPAQ